MARSEGTSLSRRELGLILVLAGLPRLFGAHHVSLWLDEILSSLRVALPLPGAWEAWEGNPVHPPLSELLQWVWFRVVESEPARRLLPTVFGISTVGLLARLSCRWFGRRVAWAVALIAALSPLHVRYSQELRAYSLGLLALVLALTAADRALERRSWRGWAVLGLSLSLCYWSLYTTATALFPVVLVTLETVARRRCGRRRGRRRDLAGLVGAVALSLALFSPWFRIVERAAARVHEQQATDWSAARLGARWQFLTVGGVEGHTLSFGALVFAVALAAGVVVAIGGPRGRAVILGAIAGSFGVEAVLQLANHWSSGRYHLASWPFLVMLAGLGCVTFSDSAARLWRALGGTGRLTGGVIAALPTAALLLFEAAGLADYYRHGRPDWRSVAQAVEATAAPDLPILVSNDWTRLSLGYYLSQLEGNPGAGISTRLQVVDARVAAADLLGPGCSVLVDSAYPTPPAIPGLFRETPAQLGFTRSKARVAAIAPAGGDLASPDPWACLPLEVEIAAGERPVPRLFRLADRLRRGASQALEFTAEDQPRLRFGWSYPELTGDGRTFRWTMGRWAAIDLEPRPAGTLRLEVWSLAEDQTLSVYRHRRRIATFPLSTASQTLEVPLPGDFGSPAVEIFTFEFSRYASAEENPRSLAVGFDRVELLP